MSLSRTPLELLKSYRLIPWFKLPLFDKCFDLSHFYMFPSDLVTFTEEILNAKLHFMRSV